MTFSTSTFLSASSSTLSISPSISWRYQFTRSPLRVPPSSGGRGGEGRGEGREGRGERGEGRGEKVEGEKEGEGEEEGVEHCMYKGLCAVDSG